MFNKSKYDIMKKEEAKLSVATLYYLAKILRLPKRYAEDTRENREKFEIEMCEIVNKLFPHFVTMSHIGYENAKDLFELDKDILAESLKRQGISEKRFEANYSKIIERYTKNLLVSMIIEEENIDVTKIKDIEVLLQMISGDPSGVVFHELVDASSISNPDNFELVSSMSSSNFDVMSLSSRQIKRLNEYHEKFMNENIYPQVTKESLESNKVIKLARRIGKMK